MQQSSNTARTLAQSSGFEQTETAGSSISEHPAATSGGGADIRRGSTEIKQQGKQACLLFVGNWTQNLSFID